MIYPFLRVPVPDVGGYVFQQKAVRYLFVYVGDRQKTPDGKTKHPKAKCIGRLEADAKGNDELMPNTNYYDLMGKPQPEVAVMEGTGRKPYKPAEPPVDQRPNFSEIALGYGLSVMLLSNQIGLLQALDKTFGESKRMQILKLAAYLCKRRQSSLAYLQDFCDQSLSVFGAETFDRRKAGDLLVELSNPVTTEDFYTHWNKARYAETSKIFYDVTSFSTYSGQIAEAHYGYNRDGEDLPQINQGLFCDWETGLPLYMCCYDGSLNDCSNFNEALIRAKQHGVGANEKTIIVMDGGFSASNFDWVHLNNFDLIAGVSADRLKAVKTAYLTWTSQLSHDTLASPWVCNGRCYVSARTPIQLGSLNGELLMCRDMDVFANKMKSLTIRKNKARETLEGLKKVPDCDFDAWSKSFAPFFVVEKCAGPKGFRFREDTEHFAEAISLCGKVTLFTHFRGNNTLSDQEIMNLYRSKESVEDCFDTTKNGLSDGRLHVHGDKQVHGKLFVLFIALILRRTIHYRLKQWLDENNYTDEDAIRELEHMRLYKYGDKWRFKNEPTKIQNEIFRNLQLGLNSDNSSQTASKLKPRSRPKRR